MTLVTTLNTAPDTCLSTTLQYRLKFQTEKTLDIAQSIIKYNKVIVK